MCSKCVSYWNCSQQGYGSDPEPSSAFAKQGLNWHFGVRQVELLSRTISSAGILQQFHNFQKFLNNFSFFKSKMEMQGCLGFVKNYRNFILRIAEKLNHSTRCWKQKWQSILTSELNSLNKLHGVACELAMNQTLTGKQLVLMTDGSFRSAGYALMIKDNPDQKLQS